MPADTELVSFMKARGIEAICLKNGRKNVFEDQYYTEQQNIHTQTGMRQYVMNKLSQTFDIEIPSEAWAAAQRGDFPTEEAAKEAGLGTKPYMETVPCWLMTQRPAALQGAAARTADPLANLQLFHAPQWKHVLALSSHKAAMQLLEAENSQAARVAEHAQAKTKQRARQRKKAEL